MLEGWIEAEAVVADVQHDVDGVGFQPHRRGRCLTVLDDIVQCFLRDPVQTECGIQPELLRDLADLEMNGQAMCDGYFSTDAPNRGRESQLLEPCRMQFVRHTVQLRAHFRGICQRPVHLLERGR